jgi:hypothetical protein
MELDELRKSQAGRARDRQLMQMGAIPSPGQEPAPGVPSTFGAPTMQGQVPIPSSAQGQVDREFLGDVARRAESPTDEFARRAIHYWPGGKMVQSVGSWADPLGSRYTRERMQLAEEGGTRELSQQTGVPEWFVRRGKTLATIPAMAAEIRALGRGAGAGFAIPAATQARENAKHYESIGQDQPWTERAQDVMSVLTSYALPEILRGAGALKQMGKLAGLEGYQALAPTAFESAPEGGTWGKDVFAKRAKEFVTESLPDTALTVGVMNKSLKKASVPDVGVQPEAPSVLQSQVDLIGKGPRKAAMTYGAFPNEVTLPKGIKTVRLKINNEPVSFAYDPKAVSPHELNMAISGDKLGTVLGMGVETKADADKVMLAQTPEGKTVNAVAVNETTLPKAQEAAAQQGLSTGPVVEPDQALADRKEQVDRELYGIRRAKAQRGGSYEDVVDTADTVSPSKPTVDVSKEPAHIVPEGITPKDFEILIEQVESGEIKTAAIKRAYGYPIHRAVLSAIKQRESEPSELTGIAPKEFPKFMRDSFRDESIRRANAAKEEAPKPAETPAAVEHKAPDGIKQSEFDSVLQAVRQGLIKTSHVRNKYGGKIHKVVVDIVKKEAQDFSDVTGGLPITSIKDVQKEIGTPGSGGVKMRDLQRRSDAAADKASAELESTKPAEEPPDKSNTSLEYYDFVEKNLSDEMKAARAAIDRGVKDETVEMRYGKDILNNMGNPSWRHVKPEAIEQAKKLYEKSGITGEDDPADYKEYSADQDVYSARHDDVRKVIAPRRTKRQQVERVPIDTTPLNRGSMWKKGDSTELPITSTANSKAVNEDARGTAPKEAAAKEVIAPTTVDAKPDQYGRKPVTRPADARFIDKTGKFLDSAGKSHPEVYTGEYSTPTMENKMLELGDVRTTNMRGEAVAELFYADAPPAAVRASIKKYYEDVLKQHPTVKTVSISMRRSPGFKEIGSHEYEELKTDADRASAPDKMVKAIDEFYAKKKEPEGTDVSK